MAYNEKTIGEGVYAADENNDRNSARGSFVRSGGAVTVGASSTDAVVNIDAADIRLDATDYSLSSGSVTLADNSTAYPRRDLVFARSGSFDFATGDPIDSDTNDTLVSEGVIDSDGLPIHAPEDIPEIQPPAFTGERTTATLLAMVYVPPGTTDSTALSADYITDMRMEGIGVSDVLRSGDAVTEIENYDTETNGPLATTVENSAGLGGLSSEEVLAGATSIADTEQLNAGASGEYRIVTVPSNHQIRIRAASVNTPQGATSGDTRCQMVSFNDDGTVNTEYTFANAYTQFPDRTYPGNNRYGFRPTNASSGTTYEIGYVVWFTIEPV